MSQSFNKGFSTIIGIVIIILVVVVLGGGILVWQKGWIVKAPISTSTKMIQPTTAQTQNTQNMVQGAMTNDEAKQFFNATEIISNDLPDSISFWTEAGCPNSFAQWAYMIPYGFSFNSCRYGIEGSHGGCKTCVMSQISLAPTPLSSAGWQTYTNTNTPSRSFGISFEYPSSWTYQDVVYLKDSGNINTVDFCPIKKGISGCGEPSTITGIGMSLQPISFTVTSPDAGSDNLRLNDNAYREIYTKMLSTFKNSPYNITIISPNGGEAFKWGQDIPITWISKGVNNVYVSASYYNDNNIAEPAGVLVPGSTDDFSFNSGECKLTYEPTSAATGSYIIKDGGNGRCGKMPVGKRIKIEIWDSDTGIFAESDNYFSIVQ